MLGSDRVQILDISKALEVTACWLELPTFSVQFRPCVMADFWVGTEAVPMAILKHHKFALSCFVNRLELCLDFL